MQMLIKLVLAGIWLVLVPTAAGALLAKRKKDYTLGESFLTGILLMFGVAEILILPATYRKMSLHFVTAAFAVILVQIVIAVLYAHMDADDSFYVGTATTSVYTDSIFQIDPYSGIAYNRLPKRYVLSPFPILLAVISQLSGGLHPAVMAHVIYPAVFFAAAYLVYHQMGKMFFPEEKRKQGIFLFFCAVLIWFSGFSVYTAGNFQLIRIWQGKAVLASVILPFLIYLGLHAVLNEQPAYSWFILALTNLAACHVSSMGIMLSPIVMGVFILVDLCRDRNLRRMFIEIACCFPALILGLVYLVI